jgi:hypothetical protein
MHMSAACTRDRLAVASAVVAAAWALVAAGPLPAAPVDPKPPEERRVVVAECLSPAGSLFQRQALNKTWTTVRVQHAMHSRDLLVTLPGGRAELESANGAVRLILWGNMPELSRSAVLESAVVLHAEVGVDLAFALERGRVVLRSNKDKEPARVRVRVREAVWDLTLPEKGDEAALELYGRWPRGVPYSADPKSIERPTADLVFLTLSGSAEVKAGSDRFTLHAPPGTGYLHWDNVDGQDSGPQRLDKLPAWTDVNAGRTTEARRVRVVYDRLRERLRDKPLPLALASLFDSADEDADKAQAELTRQVVVFSWGASDDLTRLVDALADPKHAEVRETAVEALRHWIGRGPGQDQDLDNFLVKQANYPPTQAENVLQLLHSPFDANLPETYQTLIEYLRSDKPAVRELALWHLERLAPAGRSIAFDPAGSAEERDKGYKKWKELVPDGQLPPKRK